MTTEKKHRKPFHQRQPLRFGCTQCGACCTGGADEHVFLDRDEARRICKYLSLSWPWFRRRYLGRLPEGNLVLRMKDGGDCIFLKDDGGCAVYETRPLQCRTYPFWSEVLASSYAWRREAKRCEGIGNGEIVPLEVIEAALKS